MGAADGAIFARHRVQVGGFDVSYLKGGHAGDTEPVLCLHGMGGAGRWEAYHMALGTVALTYVPQLPGWPEGQPPPGIESVQDYAALVVELLDAVGIEQGILMGHSIGGGGGPYFAISHPHPCFRPRLVGPLGVPVPPTPPPH